MKITTSLRQHRAAAAAGLALLACVALALALLQPATAQNLNNLDCRGSITKGAPAKDEVGDTNVRYKFACSGPITGYSLLSSNEIQGYETEVFGTDKVTGAVYPNDSMSCSGDLPTFGINCVGFVGYLDNAAQTANGQEKSYVNVSGNFSIDTELCAEPRTDVVLFVATATRASATRPQSLAGPFSLGRPQKAGCKPTALSGKLRVPKAPVTLSSDDTDVG